LLFIYSITHAQFPTNGLIAQYGFDNGALLVDGANSQNFTQIGTSLTAVNDRFNTATTSAIKLNGDYLTRPDITIGDYHSYSFWIKTASTSTTRQVIIDDSNRTATNASTWTGTRVTLNNGNIDVSIRYRISTSGYLDYRGLTSVSTMDVRDNKWHHITLLLESRRYTNNNGFGAEGSTQIFVDGVSQDYDDDRFGSSVIHTSINRTGNLTIANDRANTLPVAERYDGEIDDLLIYNRTLSTTEIQSIMSYNNYCSAPLASIVTVSAITENTANVDITSNGSQYDLAYHKTSEPFSNATIVTGITSGTATSLTALDIFTDYNVYVREQCTNLSDWSDAITVKTLRPIGKLYVNKNATGANSGVSWADAFTDLQDALTDVVAGEEIWIAQGTYTPHASSRSVFFTINKENLKLFGGFNGTETQLSDRIIGLNETILSADLQGNDANVADFLGNYTNTTRSADNSYRVINITANGNNLLLDGLTISDAHNNANTTSKGAAILKDKTVAYLTLRNCVIKDNVGRNDNAGLMAEFELTTATNGTGALNVENCKFINNMSRWGSGIYSFVRGNNNVDIKVINSLFDGNIAGDLNSTNAKGISGSASWFRSIANGSNVTLDLTNNTYVNNLDLGTNTVNNFNRATVGITNESGITGTFTAEVNNCIFWGNLTPSGANTRSITDLYKSPLSSLVVRNSLDPLNFNDDSITSKVNTISTDPLFTSTTDFTLQSGSPAIDTGDNTQVQTGTTDLAGNSRIFNSTVDMGPYEFGATVPVDRTLTINATNGTVITNPNPTNGTYDDGALVSLTAIPATGYQFDGWSGDATGNTNPLNLTMDADKVVTAMFSLVQHTLTLNGTNGNITTNPNPINGTYDSGSIVELTATPATGYQFDGWSGDITGTTNPINITVDADKTVTATFSPIQRILTINATNGNVNVTGAANSKSQVIAVDFYFDHGETTSMTAVPDAGYQFDGWSGDASGANNPLSLTMDANKTVTALFSPIQRTLTINATNGSVTTNPNPTNGTFDHGSMIELTATPSSGYQFDRWSGDVSGTSNPINITMDADKNVTATFIPITRVLTINTTNGHVNVTGAANSKSQKISNDFYFNDGETTSLTAVPATGYQFDGWSGDASGNTNPLSLTMNADKTVTALFSPIQRILTINATNGSVVANPSPINGTYDDGTIITLTATANTGYGFTNWSGDISGTANSITVTMNGNQTVEANFSSTASIKDANKIDILVYPNPMSNFLTIQLDGKIKIGKIIDVTGKEIKRFQKNKINTQNISSGIYILKIETEDGKIAMKKIIKN